MNDFVIADGILLEYLGDAAHVVIPEGVKYISGLTFSGKKMKSVTFPESLISIGDAAFKDCTELECVEFPKNLSHIGIWAFDGCTSLEEAAFLGDGDVDIGKEAFRGTPYEEYFDDDGAIIIGSFETEIPEDDE